MIQTIKNQTLSEKCTVYTHKSGLKIYVIEKPDYSSCYAIFGTRYGSIDTMFKTKDDKDYIKVPEGIAHFLEHKLFESEDGDAFSRYAKTGAMANAYTSFDRTCYLFSCSSNFEDSFRILLDFVQKPYFTKETVEKEQGIIGQEINMYNDSPNWRVLFNLLAALYQNHPVKIDIAGTIESIAQINEKLLYDCYNTFYNLNNMFICVAGNVKADKVFEIADELLRDSKAVEIDRAFIDEPKEVATNYKEIFLPVAMPLFAIGYKEYCNKPQKTLKERLSTEIVLKVIFGTDSPLYKDLMDSGLINENFSAEYFCGYGFSSVIVDGESTDPEQVYKKINSYLETAKSEKISENDFNRAKKALYGNMVSVYNSVENTVASMVNEAFFGDNIFDTIECIKDINLDDVNLRLNEILNKDYSAISIVKGKES